MFYLRSNKKKYFKASTSKFTEFIFLSKKYKVTITFLRLLNLHVFGISLKRFVSLFSSYLGCGYSVKVKEVKEELLLNLQKIIRQSHLNLELKNSIRTNMIRKNYLNLYSALRISQNLPSRGQRTKTNAQTMKKKRNFIKK